MIGFLSTCALSVVLTVLITVSAAPAASAALTPDQVAILANRNSPESLDVAHHYATKRGIPTNHVIEFDLPLDETISRRDYEEQVLQPVRHALVNRHLAGKVRVLVTTYGIPLRIAAPSPSPDQKRWLKDAEERRRYAEAYLERAYEQLVQIAPSGASPGGSDTAEGSTNSPVKDQQPWPARTDQAIRSAALRLQQAQDRKQLEQWNAQLVRVVKLVGGTAGIIQRLAPSSTADRGKAEAEIETLRQQVAAARQMIHLLTETPSDANRQRAYKLAESFFGLSGIFRLAGVETDIFSHKDAEASLDSELSLLWWDLDYYVLAGRLANPLHYAVHGAGEAFASRVPVLLVSRLDGPSHEVAKRLVDLALAAEEGGLTGKIYVDARGLKPEPALAYGFYDQSLRDLASLFRDHTAYQVVLEDTERRFSQPGEAPDVAVYVGWYKLRDYEDAFTFQPGAIGYHIASAEAVSLHGSREKGWCKNALEHGITATLGPIGEPYVDAFPLPSDFLGLLLTGRYSLVEAYYLTSQFVSWRMVLVGDPLYNPWRGKSLVGEKDFALSATPAGPGKLPLPPSERAFPNPISASKQVREQRQLLLARVDELISQAERATVKK